MSEGCIQPLVVLGNFHAQKCCCRAFRAVDFLCFCQGSLRCKTLGAHGLWIPFKVLLGTWRELGPPRGGHFLAGDQLYKVDTPAKSIKGVRLSFLKKIKSEVAGKSWRIFEVDVSDGNSWKFIF